MPHHFDALPFASAGRNWDLLTPPSSTNNIYGTYPYPHARAAAMNGEDPQERPEYIRSVVLGLERYNPEASSTLEAYVQQQCEERFCDCNANRALLKL